MVLSMSAFIRSVSAVASAACPVSVPIWPISVYTSSSRFAADTRKTGIFSLVSWSTILSMSSVSTTRSGFLAATASAFGLNPDRSVFGASAG